MNWLAEGLGYVFGVTGKCWRLCKTATIVKLEVLLNLAKNYDLCQCIFKNFHKIISDAVLFFLISVY